MREQWSEPGIKGRRWGPTEDAQYGVLRVKKKNYYCLCVRGGDEPTRRQHMNNIPRTDGGYSRARSPTRRSRKYVRSRVRFRSSSTILSAEDPLIGFELGRKSLSLRRRALLPGIISAWTRLGTGWKG